MALDARLLAAQGVGFPLSAVALALQGFVATSGPNQEPQPNRYRQIAARIFSGQIKGIPAGNHLYARTARRR